MPILQIENLTKCFFRHLALFRREKVLALQGLNLQVEPGSLLVLTGPNGAGKTTLLKILAGLIRPDEGRVLVDGISSDEPQKIHTRVGVATGDGRSFYARLSAFENLRIFAATHGIYGKRFQRRVAELGERIPLPGDLQVRYQELSQGMKTRLAFIRSFIHDPPILLLDEPFQSIDAKLLAVLKNWVLHDLVRRQGKTVLCVSHRYEEVAGWEGRCLRMERGQICQEDWIEGLSL